LVGEKQKRKETPLKIVLEDEVTVYFGEKGEHNPSKTEYPHEHERTSVVLSGQKIAIQKHRVRIKDSYCPVIMMDGVKV
jgi:hypothetical protein